MIGLDERRSSLDANRLSFDDNRMGGRDVLEGAFVTLLLCGLTPFSEKAGLGEGRMGRPSLSEDMVR